MTKKKRIILNISLSIIVIVSILFTIFPPQLILLKNQNPNYRRQTDNVTILKESASTPTNDTSPELPEYAEPTLSNLAAVQNMPKDISGKVVIPSVGISLPITQGIDEYKMLYAAGEQYSRTTVSPGDVGNYVLASHSTPWPDTLFTNLLNVKEGAEVYVSDDNFVYEYEVTSVKVVDPTDVDDIQQFDSNGLTYTKQLITLYTCTDQNATHRYVVRGELTKKTPNDQINSELRSAFEDWYTLVWSDNQ